MTVAAAFICARDAASIGDGGGGAGDPVVDRWRRARFGVLLDAGDGLGVGLRISKLPCLAMRRQFQLCSVETEVSKSEEDEDSHSEPVSAMSASLLREKDVSISAAAVCVEWWLLKGVMAF